MFNLLFFGTSDFAVPSLQALADDPRFHILGLVTQPDRPKGRHGILSPPAVKTAALFMGIHDIRQPEKLSDADFRGWIRAIGASCDVFVVASYGKILPQWLLDIPKMGCVNVHGSLLPRWRGASPIQAAIAVGDEKTGVTIMRMDSELDHGPILSQQEIPIGPDETGGSLHAKIASLGAETLPDTLAGYLRGDITPRAQDHAAATMCRTLTREDGEIDWNKNCHDIERLIRAYDPWPGAWTTVDGKRVKLLGSRIRPNDSSYAPGDKFVYRGHPSVKCDQNTVLEITRIQPEGKSPMGGDDFVRGNAWK